LVGRLLSCWTSWNYQRTTGEELVDFKDFLASAPDLTMIEIERSETPVPHVELE
jgi:hypothetical protein